MIAKEMGFELRRIEIELYGDLDPARLFGTSFDNRAGYKQIIVKIKPDCDADEETLAKWIESVDNRCPVSDNIQNTTPIKIELK